MNLDNNNLNDDPFNLHTWPKGTDRKIPSQSVEIAN